MTGPHPRAYLSLNGPDNVGKTTHLNRLAERDPAWQLLGSVHHHDPEPWDAVAQGDYAAWWFEQSTTRELTGMLLTSHLRRAAARQPGRTALLDRGLPMLLAAAAATCAVKDHLSVADALDTVAAIAAGHPPAPPESAILLLPSVDAERSYAITSAREGRTWTGIYVDYQHVLHHVLRGQVERSVYDAVIDCEGRSVEDVHAQVLAHATLAGPRAPHSNGDPRE